MLVGGLELPKFGILIARGDLAVEVGFENLALVQEDILCLCEAAHIPVILATQVLETLAKSGLPTRASWLTCITNHLSIVPKMEQEKKEILQVAIIIGRLVPLN